MPEEKIKKLHIGSIIQHYCSSCNMKQKDLAKKLGYSEAYISQIFRKKHVRTDVLADFSLALNHNFFHDICQQLGSSTANMADNDTVQVIIPLPKHAFANQDMLCQHCMFNIVENNNKGDVSKLQEKS